jgi:hypothetical protein
MPPAHGSGIVQIVPVPGGQVMQVVQVVHHHVTPAHFVTPDLDVRCDRMQQTGDIIVLEGNVLLLSKKHAQPMRIEAERVILNMSNGSFTVDSAVRPAPPSTGFGVQRTSAVVPPARSTVGQVIQIGYQQALPCPMSAPAISPCERMQMDLNRWNDAGTCPNCQPATPVTPAIRTQLQQFWVPLTR